MANSRKLAVSALLKVENDSAYSNIILNSVIANTDVTNEEKAFLSALFYGVLDRKITLDYVLDSLMKTPLKKVAPYTLQVLRIGLYQILYMDKVPKSAAVNESVKLIKKSKESRNSGFVNAVLRSAIRKENLLPTGDSLEDISINYSCPMWITNSFYNDYGIEDTVSLLKESIKPTSVILRVNTTKISVSELKEKLINMKIMCCECDVENALVLQSGIDIKNNTLYKKGMFHVQDTASQIAVSILSPKSKERVLDICAAPGGKSFTMAELMQNTGEIISCDIYEQRTELIKKGANRLGLNIIKTCTLDGTVYNSELGYFDCVLCDVPCSGLGVIRRKPDIKYKEITDFSELENIQYSILCNAAKYLKSGSKLLYSTCTLRKAENECNVAKFLAEHTNFNIMYEHTYMPHKDNTDGFYCALLVKC